MNTSWWMEFGFKENPYDTRALSSKEGDKLLVGRNKETKWLTEKLISYSRVPILTGDNGVGKTSIANVVAYRIINEYNNNTRRYFILELKEIQSTQLKGADLKQFEQNLYQKVIRLLLKEKTFLLGRGIEDKQISDVNNFINKIIHTEKGIGLDTPLFGGSINYNVAPNPSAESNLISIAQDWLKKCFSDPDSGGIICVVDNLENNGTSSQVQEIIEHFRDTIFAMPGLLWILCGTQFVVKGALASKRLDGCLADLPIDPVDEKDAPEIVKRRIEYCSIGNADPPVDQKLFHFVYEIVTNKQLRIALALCEEFAEHLHNNPQRKARDRSNELKSWLIQKAGRLPGRQYSVQEESWGFFDYITDLGADFLSTEYWLYNLDSEQELNKIASPLIEKSLLERVRTDDGYLLRVTRNGWLVNYQRHNQ